MWFILVEVFGPYLLFLADIPSLSETKHACNVSREARLAASVFNFITDSQFIHNIYLGFEHFTVITQCMEILIHLFKEKRVSTINHYTNSYV